MARAETFLDKDLFKRASDPRDLPLRDTKPTTDMNLQGSEIGSMDIGGGLSDKLASQVLGRIKPIEGVSSEPQMDLAADGPTLENARSLPPMQSESAAAPVEEVAPNDDNAPWWLPLAGAIIGGLAEGTGGAYAGIAQGSNALGGFYDRRDKLEKEQRDMDFKREMVSGDRDFQKELAQYKSSLSGAGKNFDEIEVIDPKDGATYYAFYDKKSGEFKRTDLMVPNNLKGKGPTYKLASKSEGGKANQYWVNTSNPNDQIPFGVEPEGSKNRYADERALDREWRKKTKVNDSKKSLYDSIKKDVLKTDRIKRLDSARATRKILNDATKNPAAATAAMAQFRGAFETGVYTDSDEKRYSSMGDLYTRSVAWIENKTKGVLPAPLAQAMLEVVNGITGEELANMGDQIDSIWGVQGKDFKEQWDQDFYSAEELKKSMLNQWNVENARQTVEGGKKGKFSAGGKKTVPPVKYKQIGEDGNTYYLHEDNIWRDKDKNEVEITE